MKFGRVTVKECFMEEVRFELEDLRFTNPFAVLPEKKENIDYIRQLHQFRELWKVIELSDHQSSGSRDCFKDFQNLL